jgi:hypothetical protein
VKYSEIDIEERSSLHIDWRLAIGSTTRRQYTIREGLAEMVWEDGIKTEG